MDEDLDLDLVVCPECREEVPPDDVCPDHEVCLWCDAECRLEEGSREDDDLE